MTGTGKEEMGRPGEGQMAQSYRMTEAAGKESYGRRSKKWNGPVTYAVLKYKMVAGRCAVKIPGQTST